MAIFQRYLSTKNRIVPGSVTVTYKVQNGGAGTLIDGARKRPLVNSERAAAPFRENVTDCNWMLPALALGTIQPKPGDSVTDPAGEIWIIQNAESVLMESDFKCYAVKAR